MAEKFYTDPDTGKKMLATPKKPQSDAVLKATVDAAYDNKLLNDYVAKYPSLTTHTGGSYTLSYGGETWTESQLKSKKGESLEELSEKVELLQNNAVYGVGKGLIKVGNSIGIDKTALEFILQNSPSLVSSLQVELNNLKATLAQVVSELQAIKDKQQ